LGIIGAQSAAIDYAEFGSDNSAGDASTVGPGMESVARLSAASLPRRRRRGVQFTLRGLLLLTLAAALALGAVEHFRGRDWAIARIEAAGGRVQRDAPPRWLQRAPRPGPAQSFDEVERIGFPSPGITGDKVNDRLLREVERFPELRSLDLQCCLYITDAGLSNLAGPSDLEQLNVRWTYTSDRGLKVLHRLRRLRNLNISSTDATNGTLTAIADCSYLSGLDLSLTEISDAGLAYRADLQQLKEVNLSRTRITDHGLKHLLALRGLEWLWLAATNVSDDGLARLTGLKKLRFVWLGHTSVTDRGLRELKAMSQLRELDLLGTIVSEQGVGELQRALPQLTIFR
jgi:hypothetical protein